MPSSPVVTAIIVIVEVVVVDNSSAGNIKLNKLFCESMTLNNSQVTTEEFSVEN